MSFTLLLGRPICTGILFNFSPLVFLFLQYFEFLQFVFFFYLWQVLVLFLGCFSYLIIYAPAMTISVREE